MTRRIAGALAILATLATLITLAIRADESATPATPRMETARVFLYGYGASPSGPVAGAGVYSVDLSSGELDRARLTDLGVGDPPQFIDVTGKHLVYYGTGGGTYSMALEASSDARRLGDSWYFVPSATAGRTWLVYLDESSAATRRDLIGTREVTVSGHVTVDGHKTAPPCAGPTVIAAVREALLCQGERGLIAFDPTDGRQLATLPGEFPLAASGDLVATCDEPCDRLHLTDPVAGESIAIKDGDGFRWIPGYDGAFSPDGSQLAVPVEPSVSVRGSKGARKLALVDIQDRSTELVPIAGSAVQDPLAFSADGTLFFATRDGALMSYRPGDDATRMVSDIGDLTVLDIEAS